MSDAIKGLKPETIWKYFAAIAKIPHGSRNEAAISKFVVDTAKKLGLEATADSIGSVVARKPASPGREGTRPICLQGHLDMVCEKNADKVHDFEKDPIELIREGNFIRANKTTLGADNGIGIAAMLAVMEEKNLVHGPLEFLFTVDEETGLNGANALSGDMIRSRTLLNLDSEEEGDLFVGCAGGVNTIGEWPLETEASSAASVAFLLRVSGLKGGHSGLEIDKGRGNSIRILTRILLKLAEKGARLSTMASGNKHNAIPREGDALVFLPKKNVDAAVAMVAELGATIRAEFASVDPELSIAFVPQPRTKKGKVLRKTLQTKLLRTLLAMPHGVIRMSADIPGLVETSTNLAIIELDKKKISVTTSQRSSVASEIAEIRDTVVTIFLMGGAKAEPVGEYPGWKPNLDSEILKVALSSYEKLYGKKPAIKAIHAGLECGIIGEKCNGMDMISFGPTLEMVHSPDERMHIDTIPKFWNFLLEILKNAK
jgi:dipeptidase D